MSPDPYEAGPPEYQSDEEPGDDDRALWAEAAAEQLETLIEIVETNARILREQGDD